LAKERRDIRFLFAMNSLYRFFVFVKFKFVRIQGQMAKRVKEFLFPSSKGLDGLAEGARDSKNCDFCTCDSDGFREKGPSHAKIMLVGEQPGEQEDAEGNPFVGSVSELLDTLLVEAGIDRGQVYATNAVKHFKWEPRSA
jgi:hypothetical protein